MAWFGKYRIVSAEEMRLIDKKTAEEYGVSYSQLMENAGKAVADFILEFNFRKTCAIFCGKGNNGGDGLVAARHLTQNGVSCKIYILNSEKGYNQLVSDNYKKAVSLGIPVQRIDSVNDIHTAEVSSCDFIIDGLLGTGTKGEVTGIFADLIEFINGKNKTVFSIDVPSGINPDKGLFQGHCIKATYTLAIGLPKSGLVKPSAKRHVGQLEVLDIGFPKELLENKVE
jgi:ADP-dependent NAD(P)H-hydrate dehydratase / NAD(P)H-hydrate epimerase